MKRILAVLLAGLMLLSLAACGGKDEVVKLGLLEAGGIASNRTKEHDAHVKQEKNVDENLEIEDIPYSNLSAALMDLESGKIDNIILDKCTADYVAARNKKIAVTYTESKTNYSMIVMENNEELYKILNNAIKAMKEDGTLDSLIANELKAYIESDPIPKDLPHFDGAKTYKIAVTGDLPPMDFVAADGKAAGFNIALLTEIANRAKVNFEIVQIETGARAMALSSGKVDVVFWTKGATCAVCNTTGTEKVEGSLVTESYFSDTIAKIELKSEK
jgi:polar amino acid transport system substrate-binding protein